jgi:hypothetical protein
MKSNIWTSPRSTGCALVTALSSRRVIANSADGHDGKRILRIDLHDAIEKSRIGLMHGLPFPVQFRRQDALDAWRKALSPMEPP